MDDSRLHHTNDEDDGNTPADHEESSSSVWSFDKTNILAMTDAGKPIFARYGSEAEIARICGFVQALRGSILYKTDLGDIQSMTTGDSMLLVFFHIGSLTLVAMASLESATEAFVRLQLEYLYCQLIFRMTERMQQVLEQNNSYDVQSLLMSSDESLIKSSLDDFDSNTTNDSSSGTRNNNSPAPFLLCGSTTLFPISSSIREGACNVLENIGNCTENTLFALFFVQKKLLCLVQPEHGPHLMRSSDLHLLLHFLGHQAQPNTQRKQEQRDFSSSEDNLHDGASSGELWIPVCLPRFNASGFLYCYTNCLDPETGLILALITHIGTTDQFQLFHKAAQTIRRRLDIPSIPPGSSRPIQITDCTTTSDPVTASNKNGKDCDEEQNSSQPNGMDKPDKQVGKDILWKRTEAFVSTHDDDEDYVDAAGNGDTIIPYIQASSTALLEELKTALDPVTCEQWYASILENILPGKSNDSNDSEIIQFAFRYNAPVQTKQREKRRRKFQPKTIGYLTQCVSSPIRDAMDQNTIQKDSSRRSLWAMYQTLSLRLRLGSACNESVQGAYAMLGRNGDGNDHTTQQTSSIPPPPGVGRHCPAMGLWESSPNFTGLVSEYDGDRTYFGMNGLEFELYFTYRGYMDTKTAAVVGAKLARRLHFKKEELFQTKPATWIEKQS